MIWDQMRHKKNKNSNKEDLNRRNISKQLLGKQSTLFGILNIIFVKKLFKRIARNSKTKEQRYNVRK